VTTVGRHIEIRGVVQGVGFRPWVYRLATEQGLGGHVRNDATGVTIEAFGPAAALDLFVRRLESSRPQAARVAQLRSWAIPAVPIHAFSILQSEEAPERRVSIPPDLAVCSECAAEAANPADRRYRYPFTNCTSCGPRFTIVRDIPYDRPATTMAAFRMCASCLQEYEDVHNRRFHAQPNACPTCGPRLKVVGVGGEIRTAADPIAAVAAALSTGCIAAIKGLGGFHLACDATASGVVRRLRERKRRDEKPFAVMVAGVAQAAEIAVLSESEAQLLTTAERPIVLARRRVDSCLAPEVAPGNPLVGVMLPYTPLHELLMRDVGIPLVMTSGNVSDEPLAYRNDEALTRLADVADLFLVHDRDIETRCDDSVVRVIAGGPAILRRSRGYVPRGIGVASRFCVPVLACGGLLKNTFCFGIADAAYPGPHIGDLENLETYQSFEESIARLQRFLGVDPVVVAHDLHPDYLSTRYAQHRPEPIKIPVQHHHAHVVSAMAEHGLTGPVIGVAYDGSGYGADGTSWGGEVLLAQHATFERVATLRPMALPGGDAAVRQPWRLALALLEDAYDGRPPVETLALFAGVPPPDVTVVREMLATHVRTPLTHGAGRYFDAIGSLVLRRPRASYEGQIALEWDGVADPYESARYGYELQRTCSPWVIDLRQMVRDVVADLRGGVAAPVISARFHNTLAAATAAAVRMAADVYGDLPVVLTGGCFQNARLAETVAAALASRLSVHLHREVPPGDGGLALGQAVVAAAIVSGSSRTC
jgi:hydrogenase maturation protein HypF